MEFRLLGPVEASVDGRQLDLGPPQQRCVWAVLLAEAPRTVPTEQLIDRVWNDHPPATARSVLYSYVTRMRNTLRTSGAEAAGVRLVRRSGGYLLELPPERVDLHRFLGLVAEARAAEGDDEHAADLLREALALWQADALSGVPGHWAEGMRTRLDGQRATALQLYHDAQLRLGRHDEIVAGLRELTADDPLDERLVRQLMTALYRSGRPAEALETYDRTRKQLAQSLGIDPGTELQGLYQQILAADSALAVPAARSAPEPPATPAPFPTPVPRQLPAPPWLFTGRVDELAALDRALDAPADEPGGTVVISAIGGTGGVGKTWLAQQWAHTHMERFPDGQLYVNLCGFDPTGEPMAPQAALRGFLDALGVEPSAIPADPDARAGLYRSVVAGKRMLILLDNARDTEQVAPLLPGSPSCTVLVTSRSRLTGLTTTHGAQPLALDVLTDAEAHRLIVRHLGADRVAAEPEAVTALLDRCAGLPLALGIIAARATTHPHFPLAALAEELREAAGRLDALDSGDITADLRTVFATSFHALDGPAAQVFGLLGLVAGPDIGTPAAAALTALPVPRVRALLRALEAAHLVQQHLPDRFRMHDLVRLYAAERGQYDHSAEARTAALQRLVDFYLHTAHAGDCLLSPHRPPIDPGRPAAGSSPSAPKDAAAALDWFEAEHACLLAVQTLAAEQGLHRQAWQLAWTMDTFHSRRGHVRDQLTTWLTAFTATEQLADPASQALAHRGLGRVRSLTSEYAVALDHLRQALALLEQTGDTNGQARTHRALAWTWGQQGDHRQALTHAEHCLRLHRTLDNSAGEANALNAVGWHHAQLGNYEQARPHCEQALALIRQDADRDRDGEADTLDSLGYIAHHTAQHVQALDYFRQALALFHAMGNTYEEANTQARLAGTHLAMGRPDEARHAWRQALDLYRAQRRTAEARHIQDRLDALAGGRSAAS
ncbi:BTAD domain-containing putative transcriptional regulator [Streptomyces sp. NPDC059373]